MSFPQVLPITYYKSSVELCQVISFSKYIVYAKFGCFSTLKIYEFSYIYSLTLICKENPSEMSKLVFGDVGVSEEKSDRGINA